MAELTHVKTAFDNTPNSQAPFTILTSFESSFSANQDTTLGGRSAGYGTLEKRDVATDIVLYKPYKNALDSLIQLVGGFQVSASPIHEWIEYDALWDDEAVGVQDTNTPGTGVVNSSGYSEATVGFFTLSNANAAIFKKGDKIRYESSAGNWILATITTVGSADSGGSGLTRLTLNSLEFNSSFAQGNLKQAPVAAKIQILDALRGSDYTYDPQPRGQVEKIYKTFIQHMSFEIAYTDRQKNSPNQYLDALTANENKLFERLKYAREMMALYSKAGVIDVTSAAAGNPTDKAFVSGGIYNTVSAYNKDTSSFTTNGSFDANKFRNALQEWFEFNFGGESGGPESRPIFASGKAMSHLGKAWENSQWFTGTEYVAGIRVNMYDHPLGRGEFIHLPIFDYRSPVVGGSMKESSPKAVMLMLPVSECVDRLTLTGEGPTSTTFKKQGGDREEYMRVTTTEGVKVKLKQYTSVLEETA